MPRHRTRTFYTAQITQLRYLVTLALHETLAPPRFEKKRYKVQCKCHRCNIVEERDGAVSAIEFLCAHNRHTTYIKGVLTTPVEAEP